MFNEANTVEAYVCDLLAGPIKAVPTRKMFPIVAMGYAGNNIFPARAVEVLRAVVLKSREDVPISASLATIIVERVYDWVVMLAFIFINLAELSRLTDEIVLFRDFTIQDVAVWGSVLFIGVLVVFLALVIWLLPKLWRGIKRVFGAIGRLFGARPDPDPQLPAATARKQDPGPPDPG